MLQRQMKFLQVPGISSERYGLEMLVVSYFYQIVERVAASRSRILCWKKGTLFRIVMRTSHFFE